MKMPWDRRAEKAARLAEDARAQLDAVLADWPRVQCAHGTLREARIRNHITERAFALRERNR